MRKLLLMATALIAASPVLPASAAPTTTTITFSLGGFLDINSVVPVPPTISNISGSFTLTFDPTLNYDNDTTDITVNNFFGPTVGSTLGFTYSASSHLLFFGGLQNDADFVVTGTNDFVLTLNVSNLANPALILCNTPGILCGAATGNGAYEASGYTSTSSGTALWFIATQDSTAAAPEPASLALLGAGLFGLGCVRRRRRQA